MKIVEIRSVVLASHSFFSYIFNTSICKAMLKEPSQQALWSDSKGWHHCEWCRLGLLTISFANERIGYLPRFSSISWWMIPGPGNCPNEKENRTLRKRNTLWHFILPSLLLYARSITMRETGFTRINHEKCSHMLLHKFNRSFTVCTMVNYKYNEQIAQ